MKKVLENIVYSVCLVLLIWVFVSWCDVLMNNAPYENKQVHNWNCFEILLEQKGY